MAAPVTLFGKPTCPWALRVRLAFAELGVPYRFVTPEHPDWDPTLALTPVLELDGARMPESGDIVAWARRRVGRAASVPAPDSPAGRFVARLEATRHPSEVPALLAALVAAIPTEGWIDGDEPGTTDTDAWSVLAAAAKFGAPLPPALSAYWERARCRPSVRSLG